MPAADLISGSNSTPQQADIDEALAWARKAVVACRVNVEVRAFLKIRPDKESLSHGE